MTDKRPIVDCDQSMVPIACPCLKDTALPTDRRQQTFQMLFLIFRFLTFDFDENT
jgi:hypothetical protein